MLKWSKMSYQKLKDLPSRVLHLFGFSITNQQKRVCFFPLPSLKNIRECWSLARAGATRGAILPTVSPEGFVWPWLRKLRRGVVNVPAFQKEITRSRGKAKERWTQQKTFSPLHFREIVWKKSYWLAPHRSIRSDRGGLQSMQTWLSFRGHQIMVHPMSTSVFSFLSSSQSSSTRDILVY